MATKNIGENISLDTLLDMLGNPNRRMILSKLAKLPHSTSDLAHSLNISRQAVHSQLKQLEENNIIENIEDGGKYRIRKNITVRIDISPDYYGINYSTSEIGTKSLSKELKDTGVSKDYKNIEAPDDKLRFLGEKIKDIQHDINKLEIERRSLLHKKETFIIELKNLMARQYKEQLLESIQKRRTKDKLIKESMNLGEEIFCTLFFNPEKYSKRITVDTLLDDLFFSDMDSEIRAMNRISVQPLLRDLSRLMGFLQKKPQEDDDWFFTF